MMKVTLLMICMVILHFSCRSQSKYDPDLNMLYKRALDLGLRNFGDADSVQEAIRLLDAVIFRSDTFREAYLTKGSFLCSLGKKEQALEEIKKVRRFNDYIELRMSEGFILEALGRRKQADSIYFSVLSEYDKMLVNFPDNVGMKINRAFTLLFTADAATATGEFDKIKSETPNDMHVLGMHQLSVFEKFNRENFIKSFCP